MGQLAKICTEDRPCQTRERVAKAYTPSNAYYPRIAIVLSIKKENMYTSLPRGVQLQVRLTPYLLPLPRCVWRASAALNFVLYTLCSFPHNNNGGKSSSSSKATQALILYTPWDCLVGGTQAAFVSELDEGRDLPRPAI